MNLRKVLGLTPAKAALDIEKLEARRADLRNAIEGAVDERMALMAEARADVSSFTALLQRLKP